MGVFAGRVGVSGRLGALRPRWEWVLSTERGLASMPRCPYPHEFGTTSPQTPDEWMQVGSDSQFLRLWMLGDGRNGLERHFGGDATAGEDLLARLTSRKAHFKGEGSVGSAFPRGVGPGMELGRWRATCANWTRTASPRRAATRTRNCLGAAPRRGSAV